MRPLGAHRTPHVLPQHWSSASFSTGPGTVLDRRRTLPRHRRAAPAFDQTRHAYPISQRTTQIRRHERKHLSCHGFYPAVGHHSCCLGMRVCARPLDSPTLQNRRRAGQVRRSPFLNLWHARNGSNPACGRERLWQNCYESICLDEPGFLGRRPKRILKNLLDIFLFGSTHRLRGQRVENLL